MDEGCELRRDSGGAGLARRITAGENGGYLGMAGEAGKGLLAARHFIKYEAEAIHIAAGGGGATR